MYMFSKSFYGSRPRLIPSGRPQKRTIRLGRTTIQRVVSSLLEYSRPWFHLVSPISNEKEPSKIIDAEKYHFSRRVLTALSPQIPLCESASHFVILSGEFCRILSLNNISHFDLFTPTTLMPPPSLPPSWFHSFFSTLTQYQFLHNGLALLSLFICINHQVIFFDPLVQGSVTFTHFACAILSSSSLIRHHCTGQRGMGTLRCINC